MAACRDAIQCNPADAEAHDGLAAGLAGLGRYEEALAAWREVARIRPGDFGAHHNAGLMLEFLQRFGESLPAFERALPRSESVRDQQTAAWHSGVAHSHLGRPGEAVSYWRRALLADPNYFDKVQPGERAMFERALAAAGDQPPARVEPLGLVAPLRGGK